MPLAQLTGCPALLYSRRGYGRPQPCELPRPLNYMHIEAMDVLPQLLAAAAIEDYILVGHSDGGSISLIHAGSCGGDRAMALIHAGSCGGDRAMALVIKVDNR